MRRFLSFFFIAFFSYSALAADAVTASRALPGSKSQAPTVESAAANSAPTRTAVTRSVVSATPTADNAIPSRSAVNSNTTASRSSAARTATNTGTSARTSVEAAASTVGRNSRTEAASINNTAAARRAGVTLRASTAEVGGRATIAGTGVQTGSNVGNNGQARSVQSRAATVATKETIAAATEKLEATATLNKSCQDQYNDCMDQFCAVIDANQKRCSCSSNLSRYTKVESAVKDANSQLNEVAQRIRYVGLSADEIRAIMSATEAEEALSGNRDTSESRNMLDEIEKLIKNPTSTTSYASGNNSTLDLDLDFSSDSSDLFSLDFLNSNSSSSFSNLRGTELYNAAKKRCNAVLNQCKDAGATTQQITGNYDLAIDKDCIAYEQGLTKMNETLVSNVRSANQMLQKARLSVLQNKNQYDIKGCISALEVCMTDDMVCGGTYTKCLDPTKRYIDENGNVVLGQNITNITAFMDGYDNSTVTADMLRTAYSMQISDANCKKGASAGGVDDGEVGNGNCTIKYLLTKIGTKQKVTDEGLCRAVLDKCQYYTYDSSGTYKPYNDVVLNYIQRAMVNVKAQQHQLISDYASSCLVDIATCYNQQVTQVNSWSSAASTNSIYNVMRGACRNVALTCAYAVFEGVNDENDQPLCKDNQNDCINNISEMFYQSLLCPDNSTYYKEGGTAGTNNFVNDRCKCNTDYVVTGATCSPGCTQGYRRNAYGTCEMCNAGTYSTGNEATECITCEAGYYCPKGSPNGRIQCMSGYYCPAGAGEMTACPDGQTSDAGAKELGDCYDREGEP